MAAAAAGQAQMANKISVCVCVFTQQSNTLTAPQYIEFYLPVCVLTSLKCSHKVQQQQIICMQKEEKEKRRWRRKWQILIWV